MLAAHQSNISRQDSLFPRLLCRRYKIFAAKYHIGCIERFLQIANLVDVVETEQPSICSPNKHSFHFHTELDITERGFSHLIFYLLN